MASKKFPLAIIVQTVDNATGPFRRIQQRVQGATSGVSRFGKRLGDLGRRSGLGNLIQGFRGVGQSIGSLVRKLGMIAGAAGLGVAGLKSLIDSQDELAKRADRLGLSIDTYAQLRFAAGQSGTEMARFDSALEGFSKRVGEAKAGTGSLVTLLKKVSPALLKQVKAAKSNEEAFNIMATAISKIEDPSKQAALAAAAFGRSGQSLLNMFKQGPEGIAALRKEYFELAGSQEDSARKSEEMADAMGRIKAASQGVKASILSGLAPTFLELADKLKTFLAENREAVQQWAADFGKKLPGMVARLGKAIKGFLGVAKGLIDFLGGGRNAAIALAAVLSRNLIMSIISLGRVIATNPIGLWITAISAVIVGIKLLIDNWDSVAAFFRSLWDRVMGFFSAAWDYMKEFLRYTPIGLVIAAWEPIKDFFKTLWDGVVAVFKTAWGVIKAIIDKVMWGVDRVINAKRKLQGKASIEAVEALDEASKRADASLENADAVMAKVDRLLAQRNSESKGRIDVNFNNAPKGTRVSGKSNGMDLGLAVGFQMGDGVAQ